MLMCSSIDFSAIVAYFIKTYPYPMICRDSLHNCPALLNKYWAWYDGRTLLSNDNKLYNIYSRNLRRVCVLLTACDYLYETGWNSKELNRTPEFILLQNECIANK